MSLPSLLYLWHSNQKSPSPTSLPFYERRSALLRQFSFDRICWANTYLRVRLGDWKSADMRVVQESLLVDLGIPSFEQRCQNPFYSDDGQCFGEGLEGPLQYPAISWSPIR